jgi:hypothetical protein
LAGATLVAVGTTTTGAMLVRTLASATLSATGTVATAAILARTLAPVTVTATGGVLPVRLAALTQTLAGATLTASGAVVGILPITILPTTLPEPRSDIFYSQQLTGDGGDGGPYTFSLVTGVLPPGLSLSTGGLILGTPLAGATLGPASWPVAMIDVPYYQLLTIAETGIGVPYPFTVQAQDTFGRTGTQAYTLTMRSGWVVPTYNGTLPSCLAVKQSPTTGVWAVAGIPMTLGTWTITVLAANTAGQIRHQTFTLTVRS